MRVVFFDIDGVLNSDQYFAAHPWPEGASWWSAAAIDPAAVALLNELARRSGCELVLSSSWRKRASLDELDRLLRSRGLEPALRHATPSLHRTPDGERFTRGDEIQRWLDQAGRVDALVIFEDEEPLAHLEPRCVRLDSASGLTREAIERAAVMLGLE